MKIKSTILSVILAAALSSCSDVVKYNDDVEDIFAANGAPVINAIFDVQDTESANPLESGTLNQMIRIAGKNLSHVKEVTFNGIQVDTKEIYATSENCYIKIPRQIPEAVTNTIVYTTELGTIERTFEVTIPSVRLEGLANEFCLPGESVQVNGEYFDLFGFGVEGSNAHITIDGTELEIDSLTENYMSIVIPEGTPDNTIINFSWTEVGDDVHSVNVPFRFSKYIFMPDLTSVGWWDKSFVSKFITDGSHDGDPVSTYGNYLRIKGSFDQWSWNTFGGGSNWPALDCRDNLDDYVFKFEVCSNSSFPFYDSESWGYYFSLNDSENYSWNPSAGISFNTYGQWQTISIPLSKVATKGVPEPGSWANFCMVLQPNTDGGWKVDHSFANFRVEPAKF